MYERERTECAQLDSVSGHVSGQRLQLPVRSMFHISAFYSSLIPNGRERVIGFSKYILGLSLTPQTHFKKVWTH